MYEVIPWFKLDRKSLFSYFDRDIMCIWKSTVENISEIGK